MASSGGHGFSAVASRASLRAWIGSLEKRPEGGKNFSEVGNMPVIFREFGYRLEMVRTLKPPPKNVQREEEGSPIGEVKILDPTDWEESPTLRSTRR